MKKTNPLHKEIEIKIAADSVSVPEFNSWCFAKLPSQYLHVSGYDIYYNQGKNVVRHRQNGGAGELTVKRRLTNKSTKNREEIDLHFDPKTAQTDIARFLEATGWNEQFKVFKDCYIFWFTNSQPATEVVIYDVRCIRPDGTKTHKSRFIEVEIHKADSNHVDSQEVIEQWEQEIRSEFPNCGITLNKSLYELYSGATYQIVKT